jgi:hypothetical protein
MRKLETSAPGLLRHANFPGEQDEARFLSPRGLRFGHNLRDGVNQSHRTVFE